MYINSSFWQQYFPMLFVMYVHVHDAGKVVLLSPFYAWCGGFAAWNIFRCGLGVFAFWIRELCEDVQTGVVGSVVFVNWKRTIGWLNSLFVMNFLLASCWASTVLTHKNLVTFLLWGLLDRRYIRCLKGLVRSGWSLAIVATVLKLQWCNWVFIAVLWQLLLLLSQVAWDYSVAVMVKWYF